MKINRILFLATLCILLSNLNIAFSTETGDPCDPLSQENECGSGWYCDANLKACANKFETLCNFNHKCTIGMQCMRNGIQVDSSGTIGVCVASEANIENNALSQALCNIYSFLTGKTARVFSGIIISIFGLSVLMGKTSYQTLIAMALGMGAIFGAPAIIALFLSKGFVC